jgi:eukaryotic-like serine/threonine-protein kinase
VIKELRPSDPASIGPYRLRGRLGTGGMGQVYLAISPGGRLVAVKQIRSELAEERGFRTRFAREIAAARNVSGMYTAVVVDSDPEAEPPWMATAYVAGPSLADAIADDGPLPVHSVLALAAGLAEALVAIHGAGVVHRDLKPSNVLLAADGPRVIDFGISRALEQSMLTTAGAVMGSPGFMSPEQARGLQEVGESTDVFSLGAVLAYAATGDGPFGAGPTPALLYRVVNEEPRLARVPDEVRPLIERCLAKDPADRPTPADILGLLGDEVDALTGAWLPGALADSVRRYSLTIETPVSPPPASAGTAESPVDASQAPVLAGLAGPAATAGKATRDVPADAGATVVTAARARRRRWRIGGAVAAVGLAAAAAVVAALAPGDAPRSSSGLAPPPIRIATRSAASPATTAARSTASATVKRTKPPKTHAGATPRPVPDPSATAQPSQATATAPAAPAPTAAQPTVSQPTRQPTTQPTTQPPSGPQTVTSYSGADSAGCATYGSIGSVSGGSSVGYSFTNDSGADMQVWYITTSASGELEGTVTPGNSFARSVKTGQDWMVANSSGGCMDIFTITSGGQVTVGV